MMAVVAATGHRTWTLARSTDLEPREIERRLANLAMAELRLAWPSTLLVGGALGWDMAMAEAARELGVRYVVIAPFPGYDRVWAPADYRRNHKVLSYADSVSFVHHEAKTTVYKDRNKRLVDGSHEVLALWNGFPSGTGHCVNYAREKYKLVKNAWPAWLRMNGK